MNGPALLEVDDLAICYRSGHAEQRVVHGVSFTIEPGEVVALVGESGSGKSTIAQSLLGLLPSNGRIERGAIRLRGADIARWPERRLRAIRGAGISLIPQDPGNSLNPVRTVGSQIAEILQVHRAGDRRAIEARVLDLLARVGLEPAATRARQYPHELSGGMKQRVLIAIAVALRPGLIVADEPTSALDVTVQRRILDLIDELRRENGTAMLLVTHDLGVAADRADRIVVLKDGLVQEQGQLTEVLDRPRSAYTRRLLADAPSRSGAPNRAASKAGEQDFAILVEGLTQEFTLRDGRSTMFRAVDGVSFRVRRGTTHAIVGESGSGKTTTVRCVVGLQKPSSGRIVIDGVDLATLEGQALRQFRRRIQLVYQNPFASLDPRQSVGAIVTEPLLNFEPISRPDRERTVREMIHRVGLPESFLGRLPRALSGGQRQRVALARALVLRPAVLVLDEAVSALDVTVQAQILALLNELQQALGLTYLFVSHDLAVVQQISDSVSVLHGGRQVDDGLVKRVFHHPASAYTTELLDAIPGRRKSVAAVT